MNKITINPKVRFGKPCIKGTRLAVEDVLNMLRAGWTINGIIEEYPELTKKDVLAVIDFTLQLVREPSNVVLVK